MKGLTKLTKLTVGLLLVVASGQVLAAGDSMDIKLTGTIAPPACKPTVSGGAVFDYGTIKAGNLQQDDYTVLQAKGLTLTITCSAPMKVVFSAVDARADTAVSPVGKVLIHSSGDPAAVLGLGTTSDGNKIGGYRIAIYSGINYLTLDGVKTGAPSIKSTDGGQTWTAYDCPGCVWLTPQAAGILSSIAAPGTLEPLAFTTLSTTLVVQAAINKGSELDLTKIVNIDGQMAIQMIYL